MTQHMQDLAGEILRLQGELDREIEARRKLLGVKLAAGLVGFEQGVLSEQRLLRTRVSHFLAQSSCATMITAPLIYSLIVPLMLLDAWVSIFQAVCFRVYGIERVRRADFIVFDRQHLAYLNWIEALNCLFCAYGNGLISYVREVSSRTEQYWCPIKHALKIHDPHKRYHQFLEYGDADGYRARLETFRDQLRASAD
ncbi:hypothetical protein [Sphingobium sp. D43FB]|uniref:hypothetical protein n=1 Tax=Sphingobium sp. D43FB TaxID=2017595 RepID=UPI000BB54A27|nr:hypothetical protein [Sphingobium sp. D43FB]PBN43623.1 hypothetical protein SxD43FB_10710 [Sphingobium sp. D43FB]